MFFIITLFCLSSLALQGMQEKPLTLEEKKEVNAKRMPWEVDGGVNKMCPFILQATGIDMTETTIQQLQKLFIKKGIVDHKTAAQVGRTDNFIIVPEKFNKKMVTFFPILTDESNKDSIPKAPHVYQAFILTTSGIDSFMRRLAFLKRITLLGVTAHKIIATIGSHAHREDLMTVDYLTQLPTLFKQDFSLQDNEEQLREKAQSVSKPTWTHQDGMEAAWHLVSSDPVMNKLYQSFTYFKKEQCKPEEMFESLAKETLEKGVSPKDPIGFITQSFGFANLKTTVNKAWGSNQEGINYLIAKEVPLEVETKLFNNSPHQEAVTRLYTFYNMLKRQSDK